MKKTFKIIYAAFFFAICSVPMIAMPFAKSTAQIEKKQLAQTPQLVSDGKLNNHFSTECEAWYQDRIPFRSNLLSAANWVKSNLFSTATANVISGKDGWLFYEETKADYMNINPMGDRELQEIAVTLSLLNEYVEKADGHFLFMPMPNKSSIYGEYMPDCFQKGSTSNLDRLQNMLSTYHVDFLDMKEFLTERKDMGLYQKRDSHWNYLGALLGYQKMMEKLEKPYKSYSNTSYTPIKNWRGDLDKLLYPRGGYYDYQYQFDIDFDPYEFLIPVGITDPQDQLAIFMGDKEENDRRISTQKLVLNDERKLYMVRDSFGRALLPFLIDNYDYALFERTERPDLSRIEEGTDMVYEIVERNLRNLLHTAPIMPAPLRENINSDLSSETITLHNKPFGEGIQLYGKLEDSMLSDDSRVYVSFYNDSKEYTFEAFPIYETEMLDDGGVYGFSLYIDDSYSLSGDYEVYILSGGKAYSAGEITFHPQTQETEKEPSESEIEQKSEIKYIDGTLKERVRIQFRDAVFTVGDNYEEIKEKLGSEAAPFSSMTNCLSGKPIYEYHYSGLTIQTNADGDIFSIELSNNLYPGTEAKTIGGISCNHTIGEAKKAFGEPTKTDNRNLFYQEGNIVLQIIQNQSLVQFLLITDSSIS